mmetsp:Transcript_10070/g.11463  ORF Transcript_10070/g.11463 Transcript_10070/m.11463 type:complete len:324 (+) Transcript_10070:349-1320(+)
MLGEGFRRLLLATELIALIGRRSEHRASASKRRLLGGTLGLLLLLRLVQNLLLCPLGCLSAAASDEGCRIAVVAAPHKHLVAQELGAGNGKTLQEHILNHGLLACEQLHEVEAGTVAGESNPEAIRRPGHGIDPCLGLVELSKDLAKLVLVVPHLSEAIIFSGINVLDVGGENPALEVSGASHHELVVGAPVQTQDSGFMLLDHLADPPVVGLFEVAHRDAFGATGDCKLVPSRAPFDAGGSTLDPQDDKRWLPHAILFFPDVGIAIVPAGHNKVGHGRPVNARHEARVSREVVQLLPLGVVIGFALGVKHLYFIVVWGQCNL